jgi:hypothetical protein
MPTISMFYGIIVRMYFAPGEHNPPHFHAYYQEYKARWSYGHVKLSRVICRADSKVGYYLGRVVPGGIVG